VPRRPVALFGTYVKLDRQRVVAVAWEKAQQTHNCCLRLTVLKYVKNASRKRTRLDIQTMNTGTNEKLLIFFCSATYIYRYNRSFLLHLRPVCRIDNAAYCVIHFHHCTSQPLGYSQLFVQISRSLNYDHRTTITVLLLSGSC